MGDQPFELRLIDDWPTHYSLQNRPFNLARAAEEGMRFQTRQPLMGRVPPDIWGRIAPAMKIPATVSPRI